ncbi:MAG: exo-alpha-sialidase [Bryobacterales bacterium]|nr:exo-alpha-sialidase [Bryobacterales bacterium]
MIHGTWLVILAAGVWAQTAQQVEGFASVVRAPAANSRPGVMPLDFRGPAAGHMTKPWWTTEGAQRLEWKTAPVPSKHDTVFAFTAASSVVPAELTRGPKAWLYYNGAAVLEFDIGQPRDRVWTNGEFQLRYESRRAEWPWSAGHRQFNPNGDSGIYRLRVPASKVTAGEAAMIGVELQPFPAWPNGWFMVKARTDTLTESVASLEQQVRQLQRDVIRLGEMNQALAVQQYNAMLDTRGTQHGILYTNGWRHLHPADIIALQNGELLVTAREGIEHISRDGDVILLRSRDQGKTWGDKQVISAVPDLDEREGCGIQLKDGTILVAVYYNGLYRDNNDYEWEEAKRRAKFGVDKQHLGTFIIRSTDNGRTWSKPNHISTKGMPFTDIEGPADAPIEMPDGSILLPVMGYNVRGDSANEAAVMLKSVDKGETWTYLSTMADDPGGKLGHFQEPGIVRTKTGRIVAAIRNQGEDNAIWTTWSDDGGKTWVPVRKSGMIGHPADLLQLADGRLLCTYGQRSARHADPGGIRATFSLDNGETWQVENEVAIRQDFLNWDIGYPESMQLGDGRILTVYYFNMFGRYFLGHSTWKP